MSEEKAEYHTEAKKEPKKTKPAKKKFTGLVKYDFRIDGKFYRAGKEYSNTDKDRFEKLIRINKIKNK